MDGEPPTPGGEQAGQLQHLFPGLVRCVKVFGVVGLSRARACDKDKDAILSAAREYLGEKLSAARTFKVETNL
mgnify:CR=1 FL=1